MFRVGAAYLAMSWLVIQVIEILSPLFRFSDKAVLAVVVLLAIGFVASLIFAWSFELTTGGLKRETDVDHSSAVDVRKAKRLDMLIICTLSLALLLFAFDKFVLDPALDDAPEQELDARARDE